MVHDLIESWFASGDPTIVFQPIFELAGAVVPFAVEALTRGPAGTQFENAGVFFEYLRQTKQEMRADRRCVDAAIRAIARADVAPSISINLHPSSLERDAGFVEFLAAVLAREHIDPRRVIIEIIEETRYCSTRALVSTLRELRAEGIRIALDDVGVGRCNYRAIIDVSPDLLKVDRYFVHGSADDGNRRAVLRSIRRLADDIGLEVVAEGIEREEDLDVIRDFGIPYGQGYLFSRPRPLADVLERPCDGTFTPQTTSSIKETHACRERRSSSWTTPTPS